MKNFYLDKDVIRVSDFNLGSFVDRPFLQINELQGEIIVRGIFTMVVLTTPKKMVVCGISRKSREDKFNQEKAIQIARGRALKTLVKLLNGKTINDPLAG